MGISIPALGVPGVLGSGGAAVDPGQVYADWIIANYNPSAFWRVTDCTSVNSPTIPAQLDSARDGTLSGWTLQNTASPVAGETLLAPLSDGNNDYGDVFSSNGSTGVADVFDGANGSLLAWAYPSVASITDGQIRYAITIETDTLSRVTIGKNSSNQWQMVHKGGATVRQVNAASPAMTSAWHMLGLTWISGSKVFAWIDDAQYDTDKNQPGAWTGTIDTATIGAKGTAPTLVWSGWLAYVMLFAGAGNVLTPTKFGEIYAGAG